MDRDRLKELVREVLARHMEMPPSAGPLPTNDSVPLDFVCERDVMDARHEGQLEIVEGAVVTPLARGTAERYEVRFELATPPVSVGTTPSCDEPIVPDLPVVALGADHGGVQLKEHLKQFLEGEGGYPVLDVGTHGTEAVDYADYAHKVAAAVGRGEARFGILVDGMGIGSCMAANRHPGVRAAVGSGILEVTNAREHNDANVLCLGGRAVGDLLARAVTMVFLTTGFGGGRHARRVAKIEAD